MLKPNQVSGVIDSMIARRLAGTGAAFGNAPTVATVLRSGTTTVDIQLASGEIINRVPVIGGAYAGDTVALKHESGRYIASGTRTAQGGAVVSTGSTSSPSGGSGVSGVFTSGNLITVDTVTNPGTTLISVDPAKLGISGGRLSKSGIGALNLQASGNPVNVYFPVGGTSAMGAGPLGVLSVVNPGIADHTHSIATSSIPLGQTIIASDASGRIGVTGLGLGGTGVPGYALYSWAAGPSFHKGQMHIGGESGSAMVLAESRSATHFRAAYDIDNYGEITATSNGSMVLFATGTDPSRANLYFVTAGGVSVGGGQPLARLHVFNTGPWSHLRMAYAGDQYADVNVDAKGNTLWQTLGTEGHILFKPQGNTGFGKSTGPVGVEVEFQSSIQAQARFSYTDDQYADVIIDAGGNATIRTTGSRITLDIQPTGGIAGTKEFSPANSYDVRLGTPFKRWSELHAAEMYIATLVKFDETTTVNGQLLISNSAILAANVAATATGVNNVPLKQNTFAVGDTGRIENGGRVEFMVCVGGPTGTGPYLYTFSRNVDGTGANDWLAGDVIVNTGQPGTGFLDLYAWWSVLGSPIEFVYKNFGANWSANLSKQTAFKLFNDAAYPQAGDCMYYGMGGGMWNQINHNLGACVQGGFAGGFEYWNGGAWVPLVGSFATSYSATNVEIGLGTGGGLPPAAARIVVFWPVAQPNWAKNTVHGISAYWVRWRVVANTTGYATNAVRHVIRASAQYGPTIAGYERGSTQFNDLRTRFAIGSLQGQYDYGWSAYGLAAGDPASTWISADSRQGFRIMRGLARMGTWDINGNMKLYNTAGTNMIALNADGAGFVAGGNVSWDSSGNTTITASLNVTGGTLNIGENLLFNSTFDSVNAQGVTAYWDVYNNAPSGDVPTVGSVAVGGVDGGRFLRVTWAQPNTGNKGIFTGGFKRPLRQGASYMLSFYAKSGSGNNVGGTMGMAWNNNPTFTTEILNPPLTVNWQRYAFKLTWLSAVDVNIFLTIRSGQNTSGTLDFDHVQLEESPALTAWKAGTSELLPGSVVASMINVAQLNAISADMGTLYAGDIRLGNQDALTWNPAAFTGLRLWKSGTLSILGGYKAGAIQAYFDTDGTLKAGGGALVLDANGIAITPGSGAGLVGGYNINRSGQVIATFEGFLDTLDNTIIANLRTQSLFTDYASQMRVSAYAPGTRRSNLMLNAGPIQNARIYLNYEPGGVDTTINHTAPHGHKFTGPVIVNDLLIVSPRAITPPIANGTPGEICWDANNIYVCISSNRWRRVTLNDY